MRFIQIKESSMNRSIRRLQGVMFAMGALLLLSSLAWRGTTAEAQTFRGTILGTVTDSGGLAIAGATVTVKNLDTGLVRTVSTTEDGSYSAPELPIGNYSVTVEKAGFKSGVVKGIRVEVSSERRADVVLQPGEVAQTVVVTGDTLPQVESTSNTLGGIIESTLATDLPVNGRDYTKLIYMVPGVAGSPDQITDSPGSFGVFSVNGARGRANNFLLDGTDMNDGYRNDPAINEAGVFGTPATILPIDAVAELRTLSNYEAEYGRNSGAIVNIVTKSGTNALHGSMLEFFRSGKMGARNYFNLASVAKSPFNNNQYGGALGGPIVKDKAFFYVDYEGQRENGAQAGVTCVPDPAQIAADGGASNTVIAALLARNPWPKPNIAGAISDDTGCSSPNLSTSTGFFNRVDSLITKVDYNFNARNFVTGRYYFGDSNQSFPFAQLAGGLLPGFNTVTPTLVQLVSLSWVKVVNASQVNEARLGWNRFKEGFFPEDSNFNPSSIGLNTGVTSPFDFGLPHISVGGYSPIGATNSIPRSRVDSNWHFIDNYSWKSGRHDIKFGYEFRRTTIQLIQDNTFRGRLGFDSIADPLGGPNNLSPLEAFLEGIPSSGKQTQGNSRRHSFENNHGFYVQDSFRLTPRFTVNFGMRWDYFGVVGEKNHLFYQLDQASDSVVPTNQLYDKDYNNFAPRFGFAYDLSGKGRTVIRGGWGLFYDAFAQDIFLGHVPYNCAFCPGPAYTSFGSGAISSAGANAGPITAGSPVFSGLSGLGDFFGTDKNIRTPYTQNFNLNLQQQFGKAFAKVGYVGARGTKLFRFRDINQPSQAQITAADLANGVTDYGVPRNFSNPNLFYINQEESSASSTYHALQTSLRLNNWRGLTSAVNFVWSHSIDDASDSEDFIPNAAQPQDSTRPHLDRGNSNFDIRRRFTWNFGYEIPKMSGSMARFKNGWGLDGVLNLQDGQPFQLNYNFEGDYSGAGQGFDRPDVVGSIVYGKAPFNFLDLTAFSVPCTFDGLGTADTNCVAGTRHFGNLGRNSLRGPAFKEVNLSLL